ncbi:crotonase/enoyl-CoA hydratase family protein [Dactylosporangium sucinum]|uniref:Enoyl-CoA hydratase n=1 Tax=Dactylosporangium sucinum TaxID=1424081 RepID=A0A917X4F5_9ACTN|nr:crotonase/enoyl-CoA hydratase family protein [Dactylosporangium sucinum]GGM64472.1 enoyl-CoA hydratase [Dactylosporangium sucinum]
MSDSFLTEVRGNVLVMTINRASARNAMDGPTAREMAAALDRLDESPELFVGVLTGAGGTFCAGMDLKAFLTGDTPEVPGRGMGGITERPPRKPVIAAVEGWALAGGLEIAIACDLIVAGESAKFGVPEVKRALVAGGGAALRLPELVGTARAMELLLTGDPVTAARAEQIGLINRVVPDGTALEAALELAAVIAANGPLAVQATRAVALGARDWDSKQRWDRQRQILGPVFSSEDATEGATAFAERRPPVWKGR